MKKHMKSADGKYHIKGKKFDMLEGSRAQVWHGTAYKTSGGLTRDHLFYNKHGRIVSRKKHATAKREKRLEKHGFFAKKGQFGAVERGVSRKKRGSRKGKRGKGTRRTRRGRK
jgi:hypothetical protein